MGLVHTIGKGILIAEISRIPTPHTGCTITAGRTQAESKGPLHIEDALNVAQLSISNPAAAAKVSIHSEEYQLSECKYFNVKKYEVADSVNLYAAVPTSTLLHAGRRRVFCNNNKYNFNKGDTYFIAANPQMVRQLRFPADGFKHKRASPIWSSALLYLVFFRCRGEHNGYAKAHVIYARWAL